MILQGAIDTFNWPEVSMVLLTILALVVFGEVVSSYLRRKIL
jgi:phosphonate transport system permease protein